MKRRRPALVCNDDKGIPSFAALAYNLSPASIRLETLEDKEYVVVPMVILTEGVHSGTSGPLYYPPEELKKTPATWNHKPVVVYHPTMNGESLSACEPAIINSRKVGIMMNTRWEKGKLKSEAWIDRSKADKVDPRIMEAVDKLEVMELSTGVFLDIDDTKGEWKGESYVGIARNFRADHLALLPDQIGACSIEDGAGLLRNAAGPASDYLVAEDPKDSSTFHLRVKRNGKPDHNLMGAAWAALHGGFRGNKYEGPGKMEALSKLKKLYKSENLDTPTAMSARYRLKTEKDVTANELSFSDITSQLQALISEKLNPSDAPGYSLYIMDVFPDGRVIYCMGGGYYQLQYKNSSTGIQLSDQPPVEVVRVTDYKTQTANNTKMNKKETVDAIINAKKGWGEDDRPALMGLSEQQLKIVQNSLQPPAPETKVVPKPETNPSPRRKSIPSRRPMQRPPRRRKS